MKKPVTSILPGFDYWEKRNKSKLDCSVAQNDLF